MRKISYCTTCKGRLWQLKQTLPTNIKLTNEDVQIVLLDYHSEDGLEDYIRQEYDEYLNDGRLVYYKLTTVVNNFDMAYAKHIVHLLAKGHVLFNLDADNFIGSTIDELSRLPQGKILIPKLVRNTHTARCGRIGITKWDYLKIGGYDIDMLGMKNDDGDFIHRGWVKGLRFVFSDDLSEPIPQSKEDKYKFIVDGDYTLPPRVVVRDNVGGEFKVNLVRSVVTNSSGDRV